MKIIADIVLGLQEQERECGSEAVQIHPGDSNESDCICNVYRFVQYPVEHHLYVDMSSPTECITPGLKARAEKNLSDFPII